MYDTDTLYVGLQVYLSHTEQQKIFFLHLKTHTAALDHEDDAVGAGGACKIACDASQA